VKKIDRFVHTIPFALAMQAGQLEPVVGRGPDDSATELRADAPVNVEGAVAGDAPVAEDSLEDREVASFVWNYFESDGSWSERHQDEFDNLVTREAIGTITAVELSHLNALQTLRRSLKAPPTGEEVLQRHRREKLDRDLVKLLKQNVRFQQATY
jgi:hypothetical protein